jgi:hypothetical protein
MNPLFNEEVVDLQSCYQDKLSECKHINLPFRKKISTIICMIFVFPSCNIDSCQGMKDSSMSHIKNSSPSDQSAFSKNDLVARTISEDDQNEELSPFGVLSNGMGRFPSTMENKENDKEHFKSNVSSEEHSKLSIRDSFYQDKMYLLEASFRSEDLANSSDSIRDVFTKAAQATDKDRKSNPHMPFHTDSTTVESVKEQHMFTLSLGLCNRLDIAVQANSPLCIKVEASCQTELSWPIKDQKFACADCNSVNLKYALNHGGHGLDEAEIDIVPYYLLLKEAVRVNLNRLHLEVSNVAISLLPVFMIAS